MHKFKAKRTKTKLGGISLIGAKTGDPSQL